MDRQEQIQNLAKIARISVSYAEDLYDSFFPRPVVPQCVADWYEEHKNDLNEDIWAYLTSWADTKWDEFKYWMYHTGKNEAITTIVNMHQFGYEVEKEARYTVRVKGIKGDKQWLVFSELAECWWFGTKEDSHYAVLEHTHKELEANGFGWVFDCEGVEVKEVDDEND